MKSHQDIKDIQKEVALKNLKAVQEDVEVGYEWKHLCKALSNVNRLITLKFDYLKRRRSTMIG